MAWPLKPAPKFDFTINVYKIKSIEERFPWLRFYWLTNYDFALNAFSDQLDSINFRLYNFIQ